MGMIALVLLVALLIPIMGILMDSPVGRALARRLEGGAPDALASPPAVNELARKVELLESEVDDLARSVDQLREENDFLQRLLEEGRPRPTLPPPAP